MWLVVANKRLEANNEKCSCKVIFNLPSFRCSNTVQAIQQTTQAESRSVALFALRLRRSRRNTSGLRVTANTLCECSIEILKQQDASVNLK